MPQRGEKKELVEHALANAREALGRKLAETSSQQKLLDGAGRDLRAAAARRAASRSTTTATSRARNAVGAMIVAGPEGFRKNQYRKFNIRSAELTPGDDFGMMREVLDAALQAADDGSAARRAARGRRRRMLGIAPADDDDATATRPGPIWC